MSTRLLAASCVLALAPSLGQAACLTDDETATIAQKYVALEPITNPEPSLTLEDARCGARKLAQALVKSQGPITGYKAGLTNPAVQQRFSTPHPLAGVMFEKTFIRSGAEVPAKFGARPLYEADIVVEVAGPGIHDAQDVQAVARQIRRYYPFMELPDLMFLDPSKIAGPAIQLINVGPRLGVLGEPFQLAADDKAAIDALATMTVKLVDGDGNTIDEGKGAGILGHPLNAVIWLAKELKAQGITLKGGELLSLGSFTKLLPPKPGLAVTVRYEGLPGVGTPSASVKFK